MTEPIPKRAQILLLSEFNRFVQAHDLVAALDPLTWNVMLTAPEVRLKKEKSGAWANPVSGHVHVH